MTSPRKEPARRLHVLANPHARKLANGTRMRALLERRGSVTYTHSRAELDDAARAVVDGRPDVVVLAGGDGSYGPALTALLEATRAAAVPMPAVALVPAGTACTVARNWGFRGGGIAAFGTADAERHAEGLLEAASAHRPVTRRRATLRVRVDGGPPVVGFMVGAGLVTRFFERYDEAGATGYRAALGLASQVLASVAVGGPLARDVLRPVRCRLLVDGAAAPIDAASLFLVSAVPDLGLGLRAAYRAGEDEARVHVVASSGSARRLAVALPRVLAGRTIGGGVDVLAAHTELALDEDDAAIVLDGDLVRCANVTVEPGPVLDVVSV